MATQQYMSGEERAAQEDAELQAAEAAFNGQPTDLEQKPQDTHTEPVEQRQETPVDWEKRYKDLQSFHDKSTDELKNKLKEAGVEPEDTDKVAVLEAQLAELQGKQEEIEIRDLVAQAQETVGSVHPDFVSVINSGEFVEWIKGQSQVYHDAIYADRPDAQMSIDALTLFKVQSGYNDRQVAAQQQQMAEQAAMGINGGHREAPNSQQEKVWTWTEIQALSADEYAKLESTIDKAITDGRVH